MLISFYRLFQAEQISHVLLKVNFGVFVLIVFLDDLFNLLYSFLIKRKENANHEAFTVPWNSNVLHYYCVPRPAAGRAAHSLLLAQGAFVVIHVRMFVSRVQKAAFFWSLSGRECPHGAIPTKCH